MSRKFSYFPQGGYIEEGYNPIMFGGKVDLSSLMEKPRSRSRSKSVSRSKSAPRSKSTARARSKSTSRARSKSRTRGGTSLGGRMRSRATGGSMLAEASKMLKGQPFKSKEARGKAVAKLIKEIKKMS